MKKKLLILTTVLLVSLFLSFSVCFATDNNMAEGLARGTENVVSDAGDAISRGSEDVGNAVGSVAEGAMNVVDGVVGGVQNTANRGTTGTTNMENRSANGTTNYTATRTSTGNATVLGMNSTAWTWLIVGAFGAAIVGLVWFYGKQHTDEKYDNYTE